MSCMEYCLTILNHLKAKLPSKALIILSTRNYSLRATYQLKQLKQIT